MYYASYKSSTLFAGVAKSSFITGPWVDMGYIFSEIGRAYWHKAEEADAAILFYGGRSYISFAGYGGYVQRVAIVEVDSKTMKALFPAVVLVEPLELWQQANNMKKVFNPILLSLPNEERLYYAQNPSASGVAAGWGYVEVGTPLLNRRRRDIVRIDPKFGFDIAAGIKATKYGSAQWSPDSLKTNTTTGGAYGPLAVENVSDFTLIIEFTANSLPGSSMYALLGRFSKRNASQNPVVSIWLTNSRFYFSIHNNGGISLELIALSLTFDRILLIFLSIK